MFLVVLNFFKGSVFVSIKKALFLSLPAISVRLNCSYVLRVLGQNSLILKLKCVFVLNFTIMRLKLFLILEKSEARVLKKLFLKKRVYVIRSAECRLIFVPIGCFITTKTNGRGTISLLLKM